MSDTSSVKNHGIDINGMSPLETAGMAISKAADPFGVTSSLLNAQMAWMMHPLELAELGDRGRHRSRHRSCPRNDDTQPHHGGRQYFGDRH